MAGPWRHPIPLALRRPKRSAAWLARRARESTFEALLARARAMQRGKPAPSPPPGAVPDESFPEAAGPVVMGVNTPLFFSNTKYGSTLDIVNDMGKLGAQVLRHPGRLQLFIDHLLYPWTAGADVPDLPLRRIMVGSPIDKDRVESSDAALDLLVGSSFPLHYLESLCRTLRATGRRGPPFLILTFLDLGQGAPTNWGALAGPGAPSGEPTGPREDPIFLPWHSNTIDHEVEHIVTGEVVKLDEDNEWNRYTLDPLSGYKRAFYARLAGAVGRWLEARWGLVGEYMAGIEIGNELEAFHAVRTSSGALEPDGTAWGDLYYDCAAELRRHCDAVPLLLPGLASYAGELPTTDTDPKAWEGKKQYLRGMLNRIEDRCADDGRYGMRDLVDGLDLHYYHMGQQETGSDRPQALAHLAVALREAKEILEDYIWTTGASGGPSIPSVADPPWLTCIEASTNVMAREELGSMSGSAPVDVYPTRMEDEALYAADAPETWKLRASERPPVYQRAATLTLGFERLADSAGTLDFQGQSVWMRLAVAMLGGAQGIGWHCPIGVSGDAFEGVGLRYDLHGTDESASQSGMRPSWWAFREFGRTLAPARVVRRLEPNRLVSSTTMEFITASFIAEDMLWVIEFEQASVLPGAARGYAYLAFLDPFWPVESTDPRPVGAELNFSAARAGSLWVVQRNTWPLREPRLVSDSGEGYPVEVWPASTPAGRIGVSPSGSRMLVDPVTVALGRYPLLLASPRQLALDSFTVVTA